MTWLSSESEDDESGVETTCEAAAPTRLSLRGELVGSDGQRSTVQ